MKIFPKIIILVIFISTITSCKQEVLVNYSESDTIQIEPGYKYITATNGSKGILYFTKKVEIQESVEPDTIILQKNSKFGVHTTTRIK